MGQVDGPPEWLSSMVRILFRAMRLESAVLHQPPVKKSHIPPLKYTPTACAGGLCTASLERTAF